MPRRKLLHRDSHRRFILMCMVGGSGHGAPLFCEWSRKTRCDRRLRERVYVATLFTDDIDIAVAIANRTHCIREAAREARAVAALKEIAGGNN